MSSRRSIMRRTTHTIKNFSIPPKLLSWNLRLKCLGLIGTWTWLQQSPMSIFHVSTRCQRGGPSFYQKKNQFNCSLIQVKNYLKRLKTIRCLETGSISNYLKTKLVYSTYEVQVVETKISISKVSILTIKVSTTNRAEIINQHFEQSTMDQCL